MGHKLSKNKWSQSEDAFLIREHNSFSYTELAKKLKRNRGSISARIRRLGLANSSNKKIALLERKGYTKESLSKAVLECNCIMDVARKLGKVVGGPTYKIITRAIKYYEIDTSHFDSWIKNRTGINKGKPIDEHLRYGSTIGSSHLKERLYKEGIKKRECELCGQGEIWQGKKMALILDHINGDSKDNRRENLRIVCPNCEGTLPTHCRGKKVLRK